MCSATESIFGSTYLFYLISLLRQENDQIQSYRSTLTDDHFDRCPHLTLTSYALAYEELADTL